MDQSRVVIGIDPGTAITGYGIVRELENGDLEWITHGVITTTREWEDPQRLLYINQELAAIIGKEKPDCCAVEKLFFQKNIKTAIGVGQGRGAALIAVAASNLPVSEYTPLEVKLAVVGYGNADKKQIQQMIKVLLKLPEVPKPDDAADALAIAICHSHTTRRDRMQING